MQNETTTPSGRDTFSGRVVTTLVIAALLLLVCFILWKASQVLLLVFAGILLAVVLRSAADLLMRVTPLTPRWAMTVVLVLGVAGISLFVWGAAGPVSEQFGKLRESLTESIGELNDYLMQREDGEEVVEKAEDMQENLFNGSEIWKRAGGIFATTLGALGGAGVVLITGVFLAYNPQTYISGFLRLIPIGRRARTCEVVTRLGVTLRGWLIGQLISMAFLFLTTWLMLWLLGVPLALILALLTGILTFIPYLGPLIALVPIVLAAFVEDPNLALYTTLLYLVIQNIEGNVLIPLILERTVHLPPALTIAGQLIMGTMLGVLGLILAPPLTAVAMVVIQMLYVEDVLGDKLDDSVDETPDWKPDDDDDDGEVEQKQEDEPAP
ncbi:AI-2E family transporter [soil metagenome]